MWKWGTGHNYQSFNETRLAKSNCRSPSKLTKITKKQKQVLEVLFIKRGFCETNGKPKDFADTLPCCEDVNKYRNVSSFLDSLNDFQASELICTLR